MHRRTVVALQTCTVLVAAALVSCSGEPEPAGQGDDRDRLTAYDPSEVRELAGFVEDFFSLRFDELPLVRIGSEEAIADRVEQLGEDPTGHVSLMQDPDARVALGLPTKASATLLTEVAGFYLGDFDEIVLRLDDDGNPPEEVRATLVHELTHSLFKQHERDADFGSRPSYDEMVAEYAANEGLAGSAQGAWELEQPEPEDPGGAEDPGVADEAESSAAPYYVSFTGLLYALGEMRLDYERFDQPGGVFDPMDLAVESAAPFFDITLPLDWQPEQVDAPDLPTGSSHRTTDTIGMGGLAAVLAESSSIDLGSVTAWRGDATTAYIDPAGDHCVAARIATVDTASAERLREALQVSLPEGATTTAADRTVSLVSCGEEPGAEHEVDYGLLASQADLAIQLASSFRDIDEIDVPEDVAICASERLHRDFDWKTIYLEDERVVDHYDTAVRECR